MPFSHLLILNQYFQIQVLVELAELQDREVGDGTTSVVIVAAELLKVVILDNCISVIYLVLHLSCLNFLLFAHYGAESK
jgi:hypothetical protein